MAKPCKICGGLSHTAAFCYQKANKPIKIKSYLPRSRKLIPAESKKAYSRRVQTYHKWMKANPPNSDGHWLCYLQISELCPKRLVRETLTLEHVITRSKAPELKYDITNIRPACGWCNKMKGSRTLEQLAKNFPHLLQYVPIKSPAVSVKKEQVHILFGEGE